METKPIEEIVHLMIIKDIWSAYYSGFLKKQEALKEIRRENYYFFNRRGKENNVRPE